MIKKKPVLTIVDGKPMLDGQALPEACDFSVRTGVGEDILTLRIKVNADQCREIVEPCYRREAILSQHVELLRKQQHSKEKEAPWLLRFVQIDENNIRLSEEAAEMARRYKELADALEAFDSTTSVFVTDSVGRESLYAITL